MYSIEGTHFGSHLQWSWEETEEQRNFQDYGVSFQLSYALIISNRAPWATCIVKKIAIFPHTNIVRSINRQ